MRNALAASARRIQLVVQRRDHARVRRDVSGGWRQEYRSGTLVTPTLRSPTWTEYQRVTELFCSRYTPRPGDVVVELGAGTGTETVSLARLVGARGQVVACEAHPATAEFLRRTVECNDLANVVVVEAAVVSSAGPVRISDLPGAGVANAIGNDGTIAVPGCTFDDLVARLQLRRIDFLKVNIEGAERALVTPMGPAWDAVKHAVISCHDFRADQGDGEQFRTSAVVRAALEAAGFQITTLPGHPLPWVRDYLFAHR